MIMFVNDWNTGQNTGDLKTIGVSVPPIYPWDPTTRGNDFWIQNILCFRKCVKWIWIECMWYQRISTNDILETCDTKRLMWQRTCVTLNVTLNALNVQSTDSKIHDICREFWTRETYKGILCFGSQCIQWHCKTIGNVFARLWIKSSQDSTWPLFLYLSFFNLLWKLKDFLWNKTSLNSQSRTNSQFL